MPTVYTPNNDVVEVDPIIVTGIRQVWYTEEPKEDVGTLPSGGRGGCRDRGKGQ